MAIKNIKSLAAKVALTTVFAAGVLHDLAYSGELYVESEIAERYLSSLDKLDSMEIEVEVSRSGPFPGKINLVNARIWTSGNLYRVDGEYVEGEKASPFRQSFILNGETGLGYKFRHDPIESGLDLVGEERKLGAIEIDDCLAPLKYLITAPFYIENIRSNGFPSLFEMEGWELENTTSGGRGGEVVVKCRTKKGFVAYSRFDAEPPRLISQRIVTPNESCVQSLTLEYDDPTSVVPRSRTFRHEVVGKTPIVETVEFNVQSVPGGIPRTRFELADLGIPNGHPFAAMSESGELADHVFYEGELVRRTSIAASLLASNGTGKWYMLAGNALAILSLGVWFGFRAFRGRTQNMQS